MKFKRLLSLLLTVLLVFSSIPMMALSAETVPERMLHFKPFNGFNSDWEQGTAQLGQCVTVTPGSTYHFSFGITTTVDVSQIALKALNNGSRDDAGITYELISNEDRGTYSWLTYSIAVPETANAEIMFGISLPGGSESYIFDMKFYDPSTAEKVNMYGNTTLDTLDGFVYGAYIFWIPDSCDPAKGGTLNDERTAWTYDYNGNTGLVEVVDYDASVIENFGAPSRMLHFKPFNGFNSDWEQGTAQLGQCVTVTPGSTYHFSFGITTSVDTSEIAFKAINNTDSRDDAGITYELVSNEDRGTYSWLTYSIAVPDTANAEIMFGISLPGGSESYIFDMKFYDPSTAEKVNMYGNTTLDTLDGFVYGAYIFWIPDSCNPDKGGTLNDEMTVWTYDYNGNTGLVEVVDYDASVIENFGAPSRMLHFKPFNGFNSDWEQGTAQLGQCVTVTPGSTYHFSFGITTSVDTSEIAFKAINNTDSRDDAGITYELISNVNRGTYSWLTYSIAVPDTANAEIMFGISLPGGSESYIFDMKFYDPSTAEKVNMYGNTTLDTLDGFVYGAYIFWIPDSCNPDKGGTLNDEMTVWTYDYNSNTGLVEVMDYDVEILKSFNDPKIEEPAAPARMLHFKPFNGNNPDWEYGNAQLGQCVTVTPGSTYYFSFGITTTVDTSEIAFKAINNTDSRDDAGITYELVSNEDRGTYSWLTYSIAVPDTANAEIMFGISLPAGSESYIFNMNFYDPSTAEKVNMYGNTTLDTLDGFVYGAYIFWIPDSCNPDKGGTLNDERTAWTYDYNSNTGLVEVMDYDVKILKSFKDPKIEEPAAPARMLHFKPFNGNNPDWEQGTAQLGQCVTVTPGSTYYFSFGIATTVDVSQIALNALNNDGNRSNANITYELVSVVDHPTYSWLTYSVTVPTTANTQIFFGVSLPAGSESYIFNMNFYDPSTTEKVNMYGNTTLDTLDGFAYGAYIFWVPHIMGTDKGGTFNEDNTVWTYNHGGNTGLVEVMDYSTENFGTLKKMLYFKYKHDQWIYNRVTLEPGATYNFSFDVTNSVTSVGVVTKEGSNRHLDIDSNVQLVSVKDYGKFSSYKYSFTLPEGWTGESDSVNMAFVGVEFGAGDEGYLFNVKLAKADDATATQKMGNANFGSGLNSWAYGYDAWFESWGTGTGLTEWSQDGVLKLKVSAYDESLWDDIVSPAMLHYSGTAGEGGSYIGQEVTLTKGNTYAISFNYKEIAGNLGEDYFVAIADSVDGRVGDILFDKDALTEVDADSAKGVKYTFTLSGDAVANKANTDTYTLVFGSTSTADVYIGDLAMYDVTDPSKTVLSKGNYVKNVYGYYSTDAAAEEGATSFTSNGMTLSSSDYNKGYFSTEKTMLHIKEYKQRGHDMLVQQIKGLEAGVEYTVSYKYHMVNGSFDVNSTENSMFFGIFAGTNNPNEGSQVTNVNLYNDHETAGRKAAFTSTTDDGITYTHTFTLNAEDVGDNDKFYAGFYTLPDPIILTECYVADLVIYRSDDATKTNLFMSDDTETWVNNWYSYWGPNLSGDKELFSRPNVEYTAEYVPYDESLFTTPDAGVHYGDSNADGVLDIRDLVNIKKRLAEAPVVLFAPADLDNNEVVDSADVVALRKHFVGTDVLEWSDYTYNLQAASDMNGGADAAAATLKTNIADYEGFVAEDYTGTKYYVAADGKASNNGTSEDTPISVDAVNDLELVAGDAVLFKRGDTFRISEAIDIEEGVGYSTYGTGDKPQILGSLQDYADASLWTANATGDIWAIELGTQDASNILFNNDTLVGVRKATLEELKVDGDFYYDVDAGKLYLFLSQVNPGKYFDNIEIATTKVLLQDLEGNDSSNYSEDVTIENLSLKYATVLGMDFNYSRGFSIGGCEIGWIGGAYFGDTGMRYGNGIQFWRAADDCVVESNYIYQIFDAALTFQGSSTNQYTGLYFENNLIEYCSMNFEFWGNSDDTLMDDIYFTSNILRFGGYGFGGLQRPGYTYQGYILAGHHTYEDSQVNNFNITANIFDIANCNYVQADGMMNQLSITSNTYYQNADSYFPVEYAAATYAKDATSFETAVKAFDSTALVNWVE